jgi:hypothetical protein
MGKLSADEGLGWRLVVRYFHERNVPGMGQYTVEQQLANLKASGGRPQSPIRPSAPRRPHQLEHTTPVTP